MIIIIIKYKFFSWLYDPSGPRPPTCRGFEITLSETRTLGRTPLDK
jgi:hypothetical protein